MPAHPSVQLQVLKLGKLSRQIDQAEADAAAYAAFEANCHLAHLVTVEGGDLYISSKPRPAKPAPLPPVAARCLVGGPLHPRAELCGKHLADTTHE